VTPSPLEPRKVAIVTGASPLINNAGLSIGKPFTDYRLDEYAAVTAVNLTGFFHITQRAIRQMLAQGGGHVVSVSTSLGDHRRRGAARRASCRMTASGLTTREE
jgi:NADP-dependent 3-hydroxy acid dehydrogenase YdfG